MPVIEIDEEVERALAGIAMEANLSLFSTETPNQVLRSLLSLNVEGEGGSAPNPSADRLRAISASSAAAAGAALTAVAGVPATAAAAGAVAAGRALSRMRIGSRLLREHGLDCAKGYFSKIGVPYQKPGEFPAALFDRGGYKIFHDEESLLSTPGVNVGKQVSIPRGLKSLPDYVPCEHTHG